MINVQESMTEALSELKDALMEGADPDAAIIEIAGDRGLRPDNLRVRASPLLNDPSIAKLQDPNFRKVDKRNKKIKAAKDAARSAQIAGSDKDFRDVICQSLGTEFSREEQQQVILDYLSDEVSRLRESK